MAIDKPLRPHPNTIFPLNGITRLCFLENIIDNSNIIVGDFTYYDDFENVGNFKKNVKYHAGKGDTEIGNSLEQVE